MTFAVAGRARFLSHLETVDTLLGALRRAGYDIALSKGMKPRPVISLALPRAVGVQAQADLADVELLGDPDPAEVAERLAAQLPHGIAVVARRAGRGPDGRARVEAAAVRGGGGGGRRLGARAARVRGRRTAARWCEPPPARPTVRSTSRSYCSSIEHEPGLLRMELRMTEAGTARPEEIAQAVAGLVGRTANIKRLVRTRIDLRPQPVGAHT